jgi:hypothetical protein
VIVDNLPIQMYQENKQSPLTPNVLLISLYAELYNVCIHNLISCTFKYDVCGGGGGGGGVVNSCAPEG